MNDILINKIQSIHRCIERAREEYYANPSDFNTNYSRQDAAILNVLRACEQAIDAANHLIKIYKLGIPTSSSESFELLEKRFIIDSGLSENLKSMVHFRNTIVHHYQKMDLEIVISVITNNLNDIVRFTEMIMEYADANPY